MAFTLSRVDRLVREWDATATNPDGSPATITGVALALLPIRTNPDAGTTWITVPFAGGKVTAILAGPDANPTGALVIPASCDLWLRVTYANGVDAERLERVTVLGGGALALAPGQALDAALVAALNDPSSASYARVVELIEARSGFGR